MVHTYVCINMYVRTREGREEDEKEDEGRDEGAAVGRGQEAEEGERQGGEGHEQELHPGADEGGEDLCVFGEGKGWGRGWVEAAGSCY